MYCKSMKLSGLLALVLAAGCTGEVPGDGVEDTAETSQALVLKNAFELNGISINGIRLNGIRLNGIRLNGIRLNGIRLNGTELSGTREDNGLTVRGDMLVGTRMEAALLDGTTTEIRVEAVDSDVLPGVDFYTLIHDDGGQAVSVCGYDAHGQPLRAIPLEGTWDYATGTHEEDATAFTFACDGAVLAKCAKWGYAPWTDRTECNGAGNCQTVPGRALHDACTRMVRADYCGDGVPHTHDGTVIDVWDNLGNMTETPDSGLALEAEWSPTGAACVAHTRWSGRDGSNRHQDYILANCPSRWEGPEGRCGDRSSTFFTENGYDAPLATRVLLRQASGDNRE